jgi:hypothetical protein
MKYLFLSTVLFVAACCKPEDQPSTAKLGIQFEFDSTQARLNQFGQPAIMLSGQAGQTPYMKNMSIHYLELVPNKNTQFGEGVIVYKGPELEVDGQKVIDFSQVLTSPADSVFASFMIKDLAPGTYEWVRVGVAAQNFDFRFNINNLPVFGNLLNQKATATSLLGFKAYLTSVTPYSINLAINDVKDHGSWFLETRFNSPFTAYNQVLSGQVAGMMTVVNPIWATSQVPVGSSYITGKLATPLVITGKETQDQKLVLSFSIMQSLVWIDPDGNGTFDLDATAGTFEQLVDMGLRGLKARVE